MKPKTPILLLVLALNGLLPAGQPSPTVVLAKRNPGPNACADLRPITARMKLMEGDIERTPWNPQAGILMATAQRATASLFRFDSFHLSGRSARQDSNDGDVMSLQWDVAFDGTVGKLVLKDTSTSSLYLLRIPNTSVSAITDLLPRLLVWPSWTPSRLTIETTEDEECAALLTMRQIGASHPEVHDYY